MKVKTQTNEFKIEHGIPVPSSSNRTGLAKVIKTMNVGDSLVMNSRNATSYLGVRLGIKLISRTITEGPDKGKFRIWRVE